MGTRSKRLRKKLHVDEFQQLGFQVYAKTVANVDGEQFWHSFIAEAIEANGLLFGGGCWPPEIDGFITAGRKHASATEKHRENLTAWMKACPEIIEFKVGPLIDAWYEA